MTAYLIPVILLSAAVTYLPRLIPFLLKDLDRLPTGLALFLRIMPIAALGALIFPGVLIDFMPLPAAGLVGISAAALLAWVRGGMILPILVSIAATFTMFQVFPA